jgi:hydrogenase maturation protease
MRKRRIVVMCFGNPLMGDDGAGIRVAGALRRVKKRLGENVEILTYKALDLALLEKFEGASQVVIVDALQSGTKPPGSVSLRHIEDTRALTLDLPSLHGLGLRQLLDLARQAELLACPVTVVGIEPRDCAEGSRMSKEVADAIPKAVRQVEMELHRAGRRTPRDS